MMDRGVVAYPATTKEMIQKILSPVNLSPSCVAIAAYVERAAAIFGAEVTCLVR
jgi:hypothetical protein